MAAPRQTILVASATAKTAASAVADLSASGSVDVRAFVRNPDADNAKALGALPSVTLFKGDFFDAASVAAAFEGVSRAFLVSAAGEDTQFDAERDFIAAATKAGVEVVVRVSTCQSLISLDSTGVYARAHARVEQFIKETGAKVVDLNPNWFIQNLGGSLGEAKAAGTISLPAAADHPAQAFVDARDVGSAGAAILLQPVEKIAEFLELYHVEVHGSELVTFGQQAKLLSEASGKEIKINTVTSEQFVGALTGVGLSEYFAKSFADTVTTVAGTTEPKRPAVQESSPLLLSIWKPKHTLAEWAKDVAPAVQ